MGIVCNKLFKKSLFDELDFNECIPLDIRNNEDLLMNYLLFMELKISLELDLVGLTQKMQMYTM